LAAVEFNGSEVFFGQGVGRAYRDAACMAWGQAKPKAKPKDKSQAKGSGAAHCPGFGF
jgi:hypothetical protein